ncbi:C-type lectin lectoxin-Lio2-like isoform X2 [Parambassis ranga]|uniref:C-type lectin lectoxin-Lio2-like isoform X2 n=1 Tax=Parambassis ranga TaxID=210632 RepID=A0A6P7KD15_9TELE|nr:C-type lectin lectoxin-Lio2-like isoform X2 [Parambassis ranga]
MEWILLFLLCLSGWRFSACRLRQYYFVPYNKTWTEAQKHCRQTYTDLATIENSEELMVFMKTSKVQLSEVWIGLYSKVDWRWSDGFNGSGAEFRAWQTSDSEPDFYTDQFCVNARGQQGWWDDRCAIEYTFVCDREPVKKHVVKTTMKIGLPSVDMNNTTVGAELLKKLQDTLKGVTGVTLKWREQPDGKVFHKERQRQKKEL